MVKMSYYFFTSTTGMPLSWFLRTLGKYPASHSGLVNRNGIILNAKPLGVEIDWWEHFIEHNQIIKMKEIIGIPEEMLGYYFWQLRYKYAKHSGYDYKALLWFAYVSWKYRNLAPEEAEKLVASQANPWDDPNRNMCTEVLGDFIEMIAVDFPDTFEGKIWHKSSLTVKHLDQITNNEKYFMEVAPNEIKFGIRNIWRPPQR